MQNIIVTGITGQVGSYMAERLVDNNKVIGLVRRSSLNNLSRIKDIIGHPNLELVEGDGIDPCFINNIVSKYKPDIIYNFMAMSHVQSSFAQPAYTMDITGKSVLYLLEAIRCFSPNTKIIHASTSEMFGSNFNIQPTSSYEIGFGLPTGSLGVKFQDEDTPFCPQSTYAIAKLAAYNYVRLYRKAYGIFATNMIMFNAESPRRGENFVTRKITKWIAGLLNYYNPMFESGSWGMSDPDNYIYNSICDKTGFPKLRLGNLESYRDWGYVTDYLDAYILASDHKEPDDFVISTGETHSIKEFLEEAFSYARDIFIKNNNHSHFPHWEECIVQDKSFFRPSEVDYLCGRSDKAKRVLGWQPKTKFKELVHLMVDYDIATQKIH